MPFEDSIKHQDAVAERAARITALKQLRVIGTIEGVSFLLLLFVAMPLKYGFDLPQAVRFTGMGHGLLFLAYVIALARAWSECERPLPWLLRGFAAAVLPFGPFWLDRTLRDEIAAEEPAGA